MKKSHITAILRIALKAVMDERRIALDNPGVAAARAALRQFQSARLVNTHADLLAAKETRAAAQFFLEDLYGTKDFTQRDADIERIIPMMERLLPLSALKYIAEAIELDALSESLDAAMASRLGEYFTQDDYVIAYQTVGRRIDREKQIAHVNSVGRSLCELVHIPLIGTTLAAMRSPAKLIRLSELYRFLERGYGAFKLMSRPEDFVATIVVRETVILENIYGGKTEPFKLSPQ
ncbi:MAG: hypothetical protein Q7R66_00255 [Undibacterium sp.]|uniref:FFLEELY motif protein n=1 Tax=Undibacterium sp. TaxID=1914977 RepID=UPI00271E1C5E|nr:hypothetical protein [Undibacterium sp.]MDO8650608.1 hypothetical protein [Undibacterium sp.]